MKSISNYIINIFQKRFISKASLEPKSIKLTLVHDQFEFLNESNLKLYQCIHSIPNLILPFWLVAWMDGFWLDSYMMVGQWELCCNAAVVVAAAPSWASWGQLKWALHSPIFRRSIHQVHLHRFPRLIGLRARHQMHHPSGNAAAAAAAAQNEEAA